MTTIALDLDGVLTDISTSILKHPDYNDEYDAVSESLFNPKGYKPLDHIFTQPLFWRNLKPIKESWHQINEWFCDGHDIYFVTARRSDASKGEIKSWLEGWQVMYTDYIVCDMHHKSDVLKDLSPALFVDDNPHEIVKVTEKITTGDLGGCEAKVFRCWYNSALIRDINQILDISYIDSLSDYKIG